MTTKTGQKGSGWVWEAPNSPKIYLADYPKQVGTMPILTTSMFIGKLRAAIDASSSAASASARPSQHTASSGTRETGK